MLNQARARGRLQQPIALRVGFQGPYIRLRFSVLRYPYQMLCTYYVASHTLVLKGSSARLSFIVLPYAYQTLCSYHVESRRQLAV